MADHRNYNITNEVFRELDKLKGFETAISKPDLGKILVRHHSTVYLISIEPVYKDIDEAVPLQLRDWGDIVHDNSHLLR